MEWGYPSAPRLWCIYIFIYFLRILFDFLWWQFCRRFKLWTFSSILFLYLNINLVNNYTDTSLFLVLNIYVAKSIECLLFGIFIPLGINSTKLYCTMYMFYFELLYFNQTSYSISGASVLYNIILPPSQDNRNASFGLMI